MAAAHSTGSEAFPSIPTIRYEGPSTKNMLAFRHYDPDALVEGKSMRDHLRFSVVYWHTFRGAGSDPFGAGTMLRPWDDGSNSVANAQKRARIAFEFIEKLGAPFYAFHDRDIAPEGASLAESNKNLDAVVKVLKEEQGRTGIKLLWGTACLFANPRFLHGAATSPNADVFAYAAAGALGSIDANTGDELIGWDTDQFPSSLYLTSAIMLTVLNMDGLKTGGLNFDAKVRRESFEPLDLFYAHIGGMDAFARGLKIAAAIRKDGRLADILKTRYASWDAGLGADIESGKHSFASLEKIALAAKDPVQHGSGRQELIENILNDLI